MKNKKVLIVIIAVVLLIVISFGVYFFLIKEDKVTTLNLFEKQWIENNRNNVIDMSIVDSIPLLSYSGEGIIIDFLDSLNKETNLSFNKVSYRLGDEINSEYAFKLVDNIEDNQILVYTDNYVLVTKEKTFLSLDDLNDLTIGVLNDNLNSINNYLYNTDVSYKTFSNNDELIAEFNNQETELDAIVLLKTTNLKQIIDNNYKIAFNISDYKKYYVLSLGSTDRLNTILTKYYERWSSLNYEDSYNKYLSKNYLSFKGITDEETVKFRSKRYNYGFLENAPFDTLLDNRLAGINYQLLSSFSNLTNAEISYKEYHNINDLLNAFNTNQIDLFYGINANEEYALDVYKTVPVFENNLMILKHSSNNIIVNSIKSLSDVSCLENSAVSKILADNNVSVKTYPNMKELINNIDSNSIVALDVYNYNYYTSELSDFIISYQFDDDDYSFIARDIADNKVFNEFLDFYIRFNDTQQFVTSGLSELLLINKAPIILKNIAVILGIIVGILLIALTIIKLKPNKKRLNLSKEDKLRYIDELTLLKNRNYLNASIEKWDSSEVYPQTIVIVDLNNIAYVNDNYGHTEGDEVIKQAANILIVNQMENSEIIRTNGNEFLIYLVGYEEKQVVSYMRKLGKELKELKHGFGAAMGYSMINDAIKTIDDAINEATLDMKNNKEELKD